MTNLPNLHVSELWEDAGAPGENPCRQWENMQTQHRKALPQPRLQPRGNHCTNEYIKNVITIYIEWQLLVPIPANK